MQYREATLNDIPQMHDLRLSVKENVLSDPLLVTYSHYRDYLLRRGKGWICEMNETLVGFAIADLQEHNIWALFVRPEAENKGIGKALHHLMLDWYFLQTDHAVWLSTESHSRAEGFYRKMGWQEAGTYGNGERRFEMTALNWQAMRKQTKVSGERKDQE